MCTNKLALGMRLNIFLLTLLSYAHQEQNSQEESLTTKLQPTFEILNHAKIFYYYIIVNDTKPFYRYVISEALAYPDSGHQHPQNGNSLRNH